MFQKMILRCVYPIGFATAVVILCSAPCRGQAVAVAEIEGQVFDHTGAVIPGAEIKATQTETQLIRTAVADSQGSYILPELPVGPYKKPTMFPQDVYGRGSVFSMADFLANVHSSVYPSAPAGSLFHGDTGVPKAFTNDKWTNFSPRLGIV